MLTKIISGPTFIYDAMLGLGLSYGTTSYMTLKTLMKHTDVFNSLISLAKKLAWKQGGHNKFLETITLCLDITAPRYWWQEFDTYRVGVTKQSESTMHTIINKPFETIDFESGCPIEVLKLLNTIREGLIDVKGPVGDDTHYFEYLKTTIWAKGADNFPVFDPVRIHSNVEQGLGLVSGMSFDQVQYEINQ